MDLEIAVILLVSLTIFIGLGGLYYKLMSEYRRIHGKGKKSV